MQNIEDVSQTSRSMSHAGVGSGVTVNRLKKRQKQVENIPGQPGQNVPKAAGVINVSRAKQKQRENEASRVSCEPNEIGMVFPSDKVVRIEEDITISNLCNQSIYFQSKSTNGDVYTKPHRGQIKAFSVITVKIILSCPKQEAEAKKLLNTFINRGHDRITFEWINISIDDDQENFVRLRTTPQQDRFKLFCNIKYKIEEALDLTTDEIDGARCAFIGSLGKITLAGDFETTEVSTVVPLTNRSIRSVIWFVKKPSSSLSTIPSEGLLQSNESASVVLKSKKFKVIKPFNLNDTLIVEWSAAPKQLKQFSSNVFDLVPKTFKLVIEIKYEYIDTANRNQIPNKKEMLRTATPNKKKVPSPHREVANEESTEFETLETQTTPRQRK